MLDYFVRKWGLAPTGSPILTPTSQLLPVLFDGRPAMLKVTDDVDEKHGHLLMRWWARLSPVWQIGADLDPKNPAPSCGDGASGLEQLIGT